MDNVLPKAAFAGHDKSAMRMSPLLLETAPLDAAAVYARLATRVEGLTSAEAAARLAEYGPNVLARDQRPSFWRLLWRAVINPLVILLVVLATVSFSTADSRAGTMMVLMIVLSVGLKLFQEAKAGSAAAKLKAMISVNATVLRDGKAGEVPLAQLVPGDVVQLAAGDMIPGDVRVVQAKDLFVIQGSLTGESFPVEKHPLETGGATTVPLELSTIAFLGTSVESGRASAVVVTTGRRTYLGGMAQSLSEQHAQTAFDRDISRFTWLLLRFMFVMVPLGRGVLLRDGRRGRPDPRDAPNDRDGVPVKGRGGDGQEAGDRQEAQRHPEPRRHGRVVHRQDRHFDDGQGSPRASLRRHATRKRRRARPRLHQ